MTQDDSINGSTKFGQLYAQLGSLLNRLRNCDPCRRLDSRLHDVPGVYSFWERTKPLYVGRTNSLRKRIQWHTRPASGHNSATFAFLIAMERATELKLSIAKMTRSEREKDLTFGALFKQAKDRVAAMDVRFVKILDPPTQAVFEVYAAMALGTPYNDFDNH